MTREEIIKIFTETGVLKTGHFLLTSGRHSDKYLQCAQLLQFPEIAEKVCRELAQNFKKMNINTVIGPAIGGILVSYEVARALNVRSIFAEREEGDMTLRRGFSIEPGEKVIVVEDVVTTGGSVKEVIAMATDLGADVVGVGALVDRSGGKVDFGVPAYYLLNLDVNSYLSNDCPICRKGIPVVKPGSRKQL
jgi:orotate phosphoribosyltransferase